MAEGSVDAPFVTVLVPCRNEARHIQACIEAILNSTYKAIEILVVDGRSTDGTRDVLNALSDANPKIRVLENPKQLTPTAFNIGLKAAKGVYLQKIDARNVVAPDYIAKMVEVLEAQPEVACVGGDYEHISETPAGDAIKVAMESKFGVGGSNYRTQSQDNSVDTVGVPMYRISIFKSLGALDENLIRNQDDEFSFRILKAGHKIFYRHDAKVTYWVRDSFSKLMRQFFQYGYYKVLVNRKHGAVTTLRQLVPPLFVLFLSLGPIILLTDEPLIALTWLLTIALYFAICSVLVPPKGSGIRNRFRILKAIFVMHMSYGTGYLRGILDFLILRKEKAATELQAPTHQ